MICFYHNADLDGQCSGALIKIAYPDCKMIGINYGDEFPWSELKNKHDKIFMVDFSLQPFNKMVDLQTLSNNKLIWIDHHKSAIEEHKKWNDEHTYLSINGIREIGKGACEIVYKYLNSNKYDVNEYIPTFVKLLSNYDVWNHDDYRVMPFQYGMRLYNTNPENIEFWNSLYNNEIKIDEIIYKGEIILDYQKMEDKKFISSCSFEVVFYGYKFICANKGLSNSRLFDSIDSEKYDGFMTFIWRKGQWTISMYSDKIDVSKIAKENGGGGHKGAAGFQTNNIDQILGVKK